jgi:uncharacterized protein (TIGR02271 family)
MEDVQKIKLAAEQLEVAKDVVAGDTVRVSVQVETEQRHVTLAAASESISIETVEIGREVAEAPPVRTEGNVTIIPILEEVTVVTKRLILKEEIRMTRTRTETTSVETVPLRTEHAVVERFSSHK